MKPIIFYNNTAIPYFVVQYCIKHGTGYKLMRIIIYSAGILMMLSNHDALPLPLPLYYVNRPNYSHVVGLAGDVFGQSLSPTGWSGVTFDWR